MFWIHIRDVRLSNRLTKMYFPYNPNLSGKDSFEIDCEILSLFNDLRYGSASTSKHQSST